MAFRSQGFRLNFINRLTDRNSERAAWEAFVNQHKLLPSVPAHIGRSWARCWSMLDPHQPPQTSRLGSDHLLSAQVANFEQLLIARPIMEDIYQYIEGSQTCVVITNSAGYILDMLGDQEILEKINSLHLDRGASLAESQVGTNAFALAILERFPVQVYGYEHYLDAMHEFSSSAAPIFDLTGNPLGVLGVLTILDSHHQHSLGLVAAGARAIENQRQADHLLNEQNRQLGSLNAILASIDEGILVWNTEDLIIHANRAANQVLNLADEELTGTMLPDLIAFPPNVRQALAERRQVTNIEANLTVRGQPHTCVISIRYIPAGRGISGCVVILRSARDVRKLVNLQLGTLASFTLDNLVGESPQMRRVQRAAATAAAARASILVYGESGTGKNLLARAIHNESPFREGPFLVFACNAIPGELVISELIGLDQALPGEQGTSRPGKFELAESGTIFFKDVESLPYEAQTILLNVLELGIVQRLGSRFPTPVDVRVIASTSISLQEMVNKGSFRPDLYYRLSPFEIQLPPLRERIQDMPILVENLLGRYKRSQTDTMKVAPQTLDLLRSYHWPGNIRELEGVLERAIAQAGRSGRLQPEHLPEFIRHPETAASQVPKVVPLDEVERQELIRAARAYQGNLTQMARALGIGRTTVWRRLKELEIPIDDYRI